MNAAVADNPRPDADIDVAAGPPIVENERGSPAGVAWWLVIMVAVVALVVWRARASNRRAA